MYKLDVYENDAMFTRIKDTMLDIDKDVLNVDTDSIYKWAIRQNKELIMSLIEQYLEEDSDDDENDNDDADDDENDNDENSDNNVDANDGEDSDMSCNDDDDDDDDSESSEVEDDDVEPDDSKAKEEANIDYEALYRNILNDYPRLQRQYPNV